MGLRPTFGAGDPFAPGTATGDPNATTILDVLDATIAGPLHAEYDILTKYGNTTTTGSVSIDGQRRNVVIGNVRYLTTDTATWTCSADGSVPCVSGIDPTRVSNVGVTSEFFATDIARRVRRDEQAKVGPTTLAKATYAGQSADCLSVPLGRGTTRYCILASGVIAFVDAGDVRITITAYSPTVDQHAFDKGA